MKTKTVKAKNIRAGDKIVLDIVATRHHIFSTIISRKNKDCFGFTMSLHDDFELEILVDEDENSKSAVERFCPELLREHKQ